MVNPTSSSAPSSSSSAALQHNSGATAAAEEGCNDEPPPIPLPPAGHPAGGASNNRQPALHAGWSAAGGGPAGAAEGGLMANEPAVPEPKVYDYGSPEAIALSRVDTASMTIATTSPSSIASRSRAASTTNSSFTAVEAGKSPTDTVVRIPTCSDGRLDASDAHTKSPEELAATLGVSLAHGLTSSNAQDRLAQHGPNALTAEGGVTWYGVLFRQVSNSLTLVLVIAMATSYGMLDFIEGGVITAVIVLNIVIGFVQDFRAEKTMESLHSLSAPEASVVRNSGKIERVKAEALVRGDIVKVKVGDVVPADLRLFEGMNFETNEALLTGESLPIPKNPSIRMKDAAAPIGDRANMAWSSSTVTKGRAVGICVATGMDTEVGKIAELLRGKKVDEGTPLKRFWGKIVRGTKNVLGLVGTPLQVKLSKFALLLFALAILLAIIVFSAASFKLNDQNLIYGICVAVAVIPESLIAVLTITMAVGTKTMAKGHVIVRKMNALEAVGGVTNICSDKTGTLTQGKMVARKALIPGLGMLTVEDSNSPFDPTNGVTKKDGHRVDGRLLESSQPLRMFLEGLALCNLSTVSREHNKESKDADTEWTAVGEPTEIALHVLAMRFDAGKKTLLGTGDWTQLSEHPFDSTVKKMSVVYRNRNRGKAEVFMKGAGEVVVPTLSLPDWKKTEIMNTIEEFAREGLRVLCVAHKTLSSDAKELTENRRAVEDQMNFLGLVGLYDPPRLETLGAVQECQVAGIKVHMLTGDHIATATAIAHEVGIISPVLSSSRAKTAVMTAAEFDALSEAQIDAMIELPLVIARCSPATKVRMVEALHRRNAFCVMTGDGTNDSPALKRADVGIAMGLNGSDVAKDASDLVLTDDNFASIVRAVEEGRRLFDNIQKFLMHLLISNIAQVVLLLIGLVFQDKSGVSIFPLSPLEILWANMVTSSFLALGLGLEEAQPDLMTRPPHDLKVGVFTWELIIDKTLYGVTMGALCLAAFAIVVFGANGGELGTDCNKGFNTSCEAVFRARGTVFAVLSFLLLITAWEVKHFSRSLFALNPARHSGPFAVFHALWYNQFLFWAVFAGFAITFPVLYIPGFNTIVFKHRPIGWEWGVVVGCTAVYLAVIEAWKAIKRWRGWGSAKVWKGMGVDQDVETGTGKSTPAMMEKV